MFALRTHLPSILSPGFSIMRCKLACHFPTSRGQTKDYSNITHYHCYGCAAEFKREKELLRHLKSSHSLSLRVQLQSQQQPEETQHHPQQQPEPQQQLHQQYPKQQQQQQEQQQKHLQQQTPPPQQQQQQRQQEQWQQQQQQEQQNLIFVDESNDFEVQMFDFKEPETRSLRQQPPKVKCPYNQCGRELHPNSLSNHIRSQHQSTKSLEINQSRYLNGICVDQKNGIYLVRKQWHGVDYPIHCQFLVAVPSPSIQCGSQICRQHTETASRSGQSGFLCDHLQSTHFLKPVVESCLSTEKLDLITSTIKWLKPERNSQCLAWKEKALKENAPLIVQMPQSLSSRFIHFSVFANVKVDHYWSFQNRVIVTVDEKLMKFNCKCSSGKRSCLHKCIAKWALAEWHPELLESPSISGEVLDEESTVLEEDSSLLPDEVPDPDKSSSSTKYPYYPPVGEAAVKMSEYIFKNKRIPPELPLTLTVEKYDYMKRFEFFKTRCLSF